MSRFVKSLQRVLLKGSKACGGFLCLSFWKCWEVSVDGSGETGASANVCTGAIHEWPPQEELASCLSFSQSEVLKRSQTAQTGLASFFSLLFFFFLLFPPPLASLFSADPLPTPPQCFSFVAHSNLNSWYQGGGSMLGYLHVKQSLWNDFSRATQVTRLL